MLKLEHNFTNVSNDTMKVLIGKRYEYLLNVASEKLSPRIAEYKLWLSTNDYSGQIEKMLYITQVLRDEEKNYHQERVIKIFLDPKDGRTIATVTGYKLIDGLMSNKVESIYYKDWIVPSAKKLEQIIDKLF